MNDEEYINKKTIKIQCPAKINLSLKVLGKRKDGFHDIESVMQAINLFDYLTISIERSDNLEINLSGNSNKIPYDEKNLVYKAAKLFFKTFKSEPYKINIYIEKKIPVSAGLAGGSTDAAGTLYGLNEIFNNPLTRKKIHKLCSELGSDLNFCLEGGMQNTKGRGEILENLPFESFQVSLIKPENIGISAKEAYTKFSEKKENYFQSKFLTYKQNENDLEWAVIDDYEELQVIKKLYPNSIMSGSGPTYFGVYVKFDPLENYWVMNNLKSIPYGIKKVPLE